ncbi:hypothetical protein IP86_17420 [Rhodopseudomonas sp. AAP120]|uniref:hypothetical protein n=1 Tax=Rhodopseudomonas TaxID=1073 RepID=UPI000164BE67|nr:MULTISPECIES: hypothetical protein [Rhodopseudomonas]ACE99648.1 hypothetical protein Rpal_1101 [Rhodopseudomonas palustris TIE-1]KPF96193.1 hypothetical protein IP86_17420 [Rhodopseudomonas sp. AAP120]
MEEPGNETLWARIPRSTKRELVPILTTGFLAQSGALTAALLVRLRDGVPWDQQPNQQAVSDVNAIFIVLNFVVILWFGYVTLNEAVAKRDEISLNAKLVGLGSAFITSLEFYSYALKSGEPERLVYTLAVLFFVFMVPFFLIRPLDRAGAQPASEGNTSAVHALAAYELVVYALITGTVCLVFDSLYFVLLNDGGRLLGHELIPAFVERISRHGRAEFWGISPGSFGLGWLVSIFLSTTVSRVGMGRFGPDRHDRLLVLAGALTINILIGVTMIGDTSVASVNGLRTITLVSLKAWLAVFMTGAFLLGFLAARQLWRVAPPAAASIAGLACFAFAGAALGAMLVLIRNRLGDSSTSNLHLIWMHAGGFAITYIFGLVAMRRMSKLLPDVEGPFALRAGVRGKSA